jgi:hypothetical protein
MISCGLGPRERVCLMQRTIATDVFEWKNSDAKNGGKLGATAKAGSLAKARQCERMTCARLSFVKQSDPRIGPLGPGSSGQARRIVCVPAGAARMGISTWQAGGKRRNYHRQKGTMQTRGAGVRMFMGNTVTLRRRRGCRNGSWLGIVHCRQSKSLRPPGKSAKQQRSGHSSWHSCNLQLSQG